jgi:hypothetical protein
LLSLDTLKTIAVATYTDKNPNPIVAQFPEITAVTIPEAQTSILLQRKTMIIGDQTIGNFASKDSLGLATLTRKVYESLGKPIKAYGFNFLCEISNRNFNSLYTKLKDSFFKTRVEKPTGSTLKFTLPNLVVEYQGARLSFKFNEAVNESGQIADFIKLDVNIHYSATEIPALDELKNKYTEMFSYVEQYLESIFN